ncbi:hypothetical protein EYR40_004539 [Pleurotus pulmonarius]|nr:hypothetical protein EYR40_004539 [Pleurotus pulmonarius]
MTTTEPPIPPEPNDNSKNTSEPDIVDFDEDPADTPFDPEASTLTSMRNLTPEDKKGRDETAKPVPRPNLRYVSVSESAPHYFIFTDPDSKKTYNVSRVDAWTIIDIAADLADGANVGYYARNTPPLYNIIASIVNKEPERPKSVLFPIIEASGLVSHPATFPPGPFILGLLDHAKHMKFHKRQSAPPPAEPTRVPARDQNHPRQHRPRNDRPRRQESERVPSLQDTRSLDRLLTSSSTTGTFLAHSMISYGQSLERDLQHAQRVNQYPRNAVRSIPYRRDNRPRHKRNHSRAPSPPKSNSPRRSPSPRSKHDDTAMQVDEDKLPSSSKAP